MKKSKKSRERDNEGAGSIHKINTICGQVICTSREETCVSRPSDHLRGSEWPHRNPSLLEARTGTGSQLWQHKDVKLDDPRSESVLTHFLSGCPLSSDLFSHGHSINHHLKLVVSSAFDSDTPSFLIIRFVHTWPSASLHVRVIMISRGCPRLSTRKWQNSTLCAISKLLSTLYVSVWVMTSTAGHLRSWFFDKEIHIEQNLIWWSRQLFLFHASRQNYFSVKYLVINVFKNRQNHSDNVFVITHMRWVGSRIFCVIELFPLFWCYAFVFLRISHMKKKKCDKNDLSQFSAHNTSKLMSVHGSRIYRRVWSCVMIMNDLAYDNSWSEHDKNETDEFFFAVRDIRIDVRHSFFTFFRNVIFWNYWRSDVSNTINFVSIISDGEKSHLMKLTTLFCWPVALRKYHLRNDD